MLGREYIIPFVGLKLGKHEFQYNITNAFFENYEYSIVKKGDVKITFELEKKETMLIGTFFIDGEVTVDCDRCGDELRTPIKDEYQLIYKFATEPEEDESLVVVYPEEFEIDIADSILEFISVSLPGRNIHPEGECNAEMMKVMQEYLMVSEDESENEEDEDVDPRWSALKNLK